MRKLKGKLFLTLVLLILIPWVLVQLMLFTRMNAIWNERLTEMRQEVAHIYRGTLEQKSVQEAHQDRIVFVLFQRALNQRMDWLSAELEARAKLLLDKRLGAEVFDHLQLRFPELLCVTSANHTAQQGDCGSVEEGYGLHVNGIHAVLEWSTLLGSPAQFGLDPGSHLVVLHSDGLAKWHTELDEVALEIVEAEVTSMGSQLSTTSIVRKLIELEDMLYEARIAPIFLDHYIALIYPRSYIGSAAHSDFQLAGYLDYFIDNQIEMVDQQMQLNVLVMLAIVLLGTFIASVWISFRISRSVQEIRDRAQSIAKGDYQSRLEVHTKDEFQELAVSLNQMMDDLKDRLLMKEALGRAVSPEVFEEIIKLDQEPFLSGQSREVTILVGDFRGFTSASERMRPEELIGFLNSYFSRFVDVIFKYQGTLDKYLGDGIMVVFGAPVPMDDHANRAIRAAQEILQIVDQFNEERKADGRDQLNYGIGINSGKVVAGRVGTRERFDYTVIGDEVNLAFRTQEFCKEMAKRLLITENTLNHANLDHLEYDSVGSVTARGRSKPVDLYSVNEKSLNATQSTAS